MSKVQIHVFSGPGDRVYLRVQALGVLFWRELFEDSRGETLTASVGYDSTCGFGYTDPDCDTEKHHGLGEWDFVPRKKRYTCKCERPDYEEISCAVFVKDGYAYIGQPVNHRFDEVDGAEAERMAVERLITHYNEYLH